MIHPNVQKLIDRYSTDRMTTKGSALRSEIRKAPPESHAAAWTAYAMLTAAARFKPTDSDSPEYRAYEAVHNALMNVLDDLIWLDGLSTSPCFRLHLSPERYRAAVEWYG
jgi:hypothetical protein